uniref:(northern house mosquito) hypothetical protein n=1 Tax=Culex pipiens TaxID=7175 RepID=A0A8D8NSX0_CULPI
MFRSLKKTDLDAGEFHFILDVFFKCVNPNNVYPNNGYFYCSYLKATCNILEQFITINGDVDTSASCVASPVVQFRETALQQKGNNLWEPWMKSQAEIMLDLLKLTPMSGVRCNCFSLCFSTVCYHQNISHSGRVDSNLNDRLTTISP